MPIDNYLQVRLDFAQLPAEIQLSVIFSGSSRGQQRRVIGMFLALNGVIANEHLGFCLHQGIVDISRYWEEKTGPGLPGEPQIHFLLAGANAEQVSRDLYSVKKHNS